MKLTINSEKVLETAEKYPESKNVLNSLFPEAFESHKPFCIVNDVLIRMNNDTYCFYQVVEIPNSMRLAIKNITSGHIWSTSIEPSYESLCGTANKVVTCGEFEELTKGQRRDFKVLTAKAAKSLFTIDI